MPPLTALWDPEDVLEIGQVLSGITCVGEAKTHGRRCRRHLARASCQQASKIILRISCMVFSNPRVDDALAPLASLLICKYSNHQEQVEEVVERWRGRIDRALAAQLEDDIQHEQGILDHAVPQAGEISDREIANARRERAIAHQESETTRREIETARRDVAIARQETENARREVTIARLDNETFRSDAAIARQALEAAQRVIAISRQETQVARRDTATARQETQAARRDAAIARQEAHSLRLEAARNREVMNALAQHLATLEAAVRATPTRTVETSPPNPPTSSTRHLERPSNDYIDREDPPASLAATYPVERQLITISSSSNRHSVPTEETNGRQASVGDCSICLNRLGDEGIVRCVAQCQQPFHGECIDVWLEEQTICPLW